MNQKDKLKDLIDNPKVPNVSEWVYEVEAFLDEINENNEEAWVLIDGIKRQAPQGAMKLKGDLLTYIERFLQGSKARSNLIRMKPC